LRQKRRAVSPYKRPDNCNGDGGNLANRYQARPISKTMMAARFYRLAIFSRNDRFPHFPNIFPVSGMLCSLERIHSPRHTANKRPSAQGQELPTRDVPPGLGFMLGFRRKTTKERRPRARPELLSSSTGRRAVRAVRPTSLLGRCTRTPTRSDKSNWGLLGLWAAAAPAGRGRGQRCSEQRPTQRNANCKTTRHPAGQPRPRT
jgi:hypothetical protein